MPRRLILLLCAIVLALPGLAAEDDARIAQLLASIQPEEREKGIDLLAKGANATTAKRLLPLLRDRDWGVQMAAIRALGPVDFKPGRDALLELSIGGEVLAVRTLAARMLAEHAADEAARRLAKSVFHYTKEERIAPIQALGILGTEGAIQVLEKLLGAGDPLHRAEAALALGRLRAGEKTLLKALQDKKDLVSLRAAQALARIDTEVARAAVLDFADGAPEPYILRRIGRSGMESNAEAFGAALEARLPVCKSPASLLQVAVEGGVKRCAAAARAHLGAQDPLVQAWAAKLIALGGAESDLDALTPLLDSKDERVRRAAAAAIAALPGEGRSTALALLLRHPRPEVAAEGVREALRRRDRPNAPLLVDLAKGGGAGKGDWQVRAAACVAAGWVGGMEAFPALVELSSSRDWRIEAAALEGLFRVYDKASIPVLTSKFDDRHPVVRLAARKNLQYMTQKKLTTRAQYETYWAAEKDKFDLIHPEDQAKQLEETGYHVRRDMLEILRKTDIVTILGRWDRVEKVLEDLDIPQAAVRAQEVKGYGLNPKQVVLVNCEGSVDSETAEYLQWFVVTGGYMATTDWSLVNAVHRTFPGVVEKYGKRSTSNDVVIVEEACPGHPVLREVFREGVELRWWLEIIAFPLELPDPVRAEVLVDSLEMLLRYERSAMMVVFPAGLGKVLHSTSHFYLQKEGFARESNPQRRRVFALDNLGLTMEEIRKLDEKKFFENVNDTTPISKSYSMFHLLVNFIEEKRRIDLGK
ncbi:MAG: HEAT repeat domain-containing protein [Planctomycetaceae bacterium]